MEGTLWEGFSLGCLSESSSKSERFRNWKISFDKLHGRPFNFDFFNNLTSTFIEALVAARHFGSGAGDLGNEHGFEESGFRLDLSGVHDSSGGRNDLTLASVNSIGVEFDIFDVEGGVFHVLVAENAFVVDVLESGGEGILDILEILDALGVIDQEVTDVATVGSHPEVPNLTGGVLIPIPVSHESPDLGLFVQSRTGTDFTGLDRKTEFIVDRFCVTPKSVLLVGGFRKAGLR